MTSVFDVEIHESAAELKTLLSDQTCARQRERVRALYLRASAQVQSKLPPEVLEQRRQRLTERTGFDS